MAIYWWHRYEKIGKWVFVPALPFYPRSDDFVAFIKGIISARMEGNLLILNQAYGNCHFFGDESPSRNAGKLLYRRPRLDPLRPLIILFQDGAHVVKVGTPGIGKSQSRNEDVYDLIRDFEDKSNEKARTIVLHKSPDPRQEFLFVLKLWRQTLGNNDSLCFSCEQWRDRSAFRNACLNNPDFRYPKPVNKLYYLVDITGGDKSAVMSFPSIMFKMVIYTSPDEKAYSSFAKWGVKRRFIPTWDLEDTLDCFTAMKNKYNSHPEGIYAGIVGLFPMNLTEADITARHVKYGGVIRHIFTMDINDVDRYLADGASKVDVNLASRSVGAREIGDTGIVHRLLHYIVDKNPDNDSYNFTVATKMWGSRYIADLVAQFQLIN